VRSYTGFDISGELIAEARGRCAEIGNARFFESDGSGVPPEVRDRSYDLAFAMAVFIHCPKVITGSLVEQAFACVKSGGQMRLQLLADLADPTGITSLDHFDAHHRQAEAIENAVQGARELIDERRYEGERFRYEEARDFLTARTGGDVQLLRFDQAFIYAIVKKLP
jgi:hypothetical protein